MTQTHPQYRKDRQVLTELLQAAPEDYPLAELARLVIRYDGFPGAEDIRLDLDKALGNWQLTREDLFARTREIHLLRPVYRSSDSDQEDWS